MTKEIKINDILNAVDDISKIQKRKNKIVKKSDFEYHDDVLNLNNRAKSNRSDVLVLSEMIE